MRIGDYLVEKGLITNDQLEEGLAKQKADGGLVGEILVALGHLSESDLDKALAELG